MVIPTNINGALPLTFVEINGQDLTNYLASGSTVEWYDVSKDAGRDVTNANGDMILNVINDKYKLTLQTRPMTQSEVADFYREISKQPTMSVRFFDPYTGSMKTINAYRGNRTVTAMQPHGGELLFNSFTQGIIEL